ncbi:hypothetical protein H8959_011657 [Pygathrix nigripes]
MVRPTRGSERGAGGDLNPGPAALTLPENSLRPHRSAYFAPAVRARDLEERPGRERWGRASGSLLLELEMTMPRRQASCDVQHNVLLNYRDPPPNGGSGSLLH